MDGTDSKILQLIQTDSRRSAGELGRVVGLSVSAARDRLRRLAATGVVKAERAVIDPRRVGLPCCAFLLVELGPQADDRAFAAEIAQFPAVQEAHRITGDHSWLLKLRLHDPSELASFVTDILKARLGATGATTMIALDTVKETTELPLSLPAAVPPPTGR